MRREVIFINIFFFKTRKFILRAVHILNPVSWLLDVVELLHIPSFLFCLCRLHNFLYDLFI